MYDDICCSRMKIEIEQFSNRILNKRGELEALIWYEPNIRRYCILDCRKPDKCSGHPIRFCPWCGKKLPEELHPDDTILREYGEDYIKFPNDPGYKELPPEVKKEFETDEWWKKRNIGPDDPGF